MSVICSARCALPLLAEAGPSSLPPWFDEFAKTLWVVGAAVVFACFAFVLVSVWMRGLMERGEL